MNRCIFREATIQSERLIIIRIAAVKSKSFTESRELSGTDSLCPQLRNNSQQYEQKPQIIQDLDDWCLVFQTRLVARKGARL